MRGDQLRLFWLGDRPSPTASFFFSRTWCAGNNSEQKMTEQWVSVQMLDIFLRLQSLGRFAGAWHADAPKLEMTLMVSRVDLGAVAQA